MRCIASMNHSHKSEHQKYLSSVGMDASVGNRAPGLVPFVVCVGGRLHWEARRFIDELLGEHPDELRRLKMRIAKGSWLYFKVEWPSRRVLDGKRHYTLPVTRGRPLVVQVASFYCDKVVQLSQ